MRHRKSGRKFGMDGSARKAMFRNMVTSLFVHGQIRTTAERAKELRGYADRMISIGKRAPELAGLDGAALADAKAARVAAIRRIRNWVHDDSAIKKLMGEFSERYANRAGGYTRVLRLGRRRPGDNARMAVISLVEEAAPVQEVASSEPVKAKATEKVSKFTEALARYDKEMTEVVGEADYDKDLLRKVTKALGPSIYNADAARVSMSDKAETDLVKKNFLIKKLGLEDGPELDEAIAEVGEWFGSSNRNKFRAMFYYKLVLRFGKQSVYE